MLTLDKIYHAAFVLKKVARKTDLIKATKLSDHCDLYLKTENLQETGSFKLRGAYYKISQLTDEEKSHGILACSAGNHAQGVAMAATRNGIKSLICMPDGAPISKVEATKQLGAEVRLVKGAYDDAYATALQIQEETGATFIHPFDDPEVIAGQGTIGLEILDELEDPDAVVVPIGGGGLISGVAYAIKHLNPKVKVYGVQAAGAASMVESQKAGEPIMLDRADTFADGIAVKHPGDLTYELVKEYVDEIVKTFKDLGFKVFLDLKFHVIPHQVRGAARSASLAGADLLSVHGLGSGAMLAACREGAEEAREDRAKLVAITVLTSMNQDALAEIGVESPVAEEAARLAKLAQANGIDGIVCSPMEAHDMRELLGPDALIVTPGVRPVGAALGDQSRVATPSQAIERGASHIVVGRPITGADDPVAAFDAIVAELVENVA